MRGVSRSRNLRTFTSGSILTGDADAAHVHHGMNGGEIVDAVESVHLSIVRLNLIARFAALMVTMRMDLLNGSRVRVEDTRGKGSKLEALFLVASVAFRGDLIIVMVAEVNSLTDGHPSLGLS